MRIGVLAVQGDFIEHIETLNKLGAPCFEIRQKKDLEQPFDGLILPGGESTTMGKLLRELELLEPLRRKIEQGFPVFGTCAGMILLAQDISNDERSCFRTMAVKVRRNAYGRQLGSFRTTAGFKGIGPVHMVFIRAPYLEAVSDQVEILAEVDGRIVAARQGNQLATAFHPELTNDLSVHRYFLEIVKRSLVPSP
jgi:5'-phosphate synthase pdxT subunit